MKYNITLLRKPTCEELELKINAELLKNPNFFANASNYGFRFNSPISIHNDWHGLAFLVTNNDDILLYCSFGVQQPLNIVSEVLLISFCKNPILIMQIINDLMNRLYDVYGIKIISFSACKNEFTYTLFHKITSSTKLNEKYFPNYKGREVGYFKNQMSLQNGKNVDAYYFEIERKL